MNPTQIIKSLMGKMNPEQVVMQMIGNNTNPMITNLIQMAQKGDSKGIEEFARNYFRERNMDFDTEFSKFMSNFKK